MTTQETQFNRHPLAFILCVLMALMMTSPVLLADEIVLKNGHKLEGKFLRREGQFIVFMRPYGELKLPNAKVASVTRKHSVFDDYANLVSTLKKKPGSRAFHMAVARWCRGKGLKKYMRDHLAEVLKLNRDDAKAREMLGEMKVGEVWLPKNRAMQKLGYSRHKGKWIDAKERRKIAQKKAEKRRLVKLERQLNREVSALFSVSEKRALKAKRSLKVLARKERIQGLGRLADSYYLQGRAYRQYLGGGTRVEYRSQLAQITGMKEFKTGLGVGSGVTIQLPSLKRTSLGTTVIAP